MFARIATMLLVLVPSLAHAQNGSFLGRPASTWQGDLTKTDAAARRSAAFALGKIGNRAAEALPQLSKLLREDNDARVREAAACAIGEIARESLRGDAGLVPKLGEALTKDADPLVRRSAAYAIGCLGKESIGGLTYLTTALEDKSPAVRQNVCWALGKLVDGVVPGLQKGLHDADPLVQRDAAMSLSGLPPKDVRPALPDLFDLCAADNTEVRRAALTVLVKAVGSSDTKGAASIAAALNDADEEIRNIAALTLSNIGGEAAAPAVPILVQALRGSDAELRRQAAAALRNIGPSARKALPDLVKGLTDPDEELRRNSALALAGLADAAVDAYPALLKMVEDAGERPEVRIEAAVALARMGNVPPALEAVPRFLRVVADPTQDARVRERVIWALRVHNARLQSIPGVYEAFTKVLGEQPMQTNRMLRYDCAFMMGMLQGPDVGEAVLNTLHEFLKDGSIQIYTGASVNVAAGSTEGSAGRVDRKETGKGDGRVMAIRALNRVGPDKTGKHKGIVRELRNLSTAPGIDPDLKEGARKLLSQLD